MRLARYGAPRFGEARYGQATRRYLPARQLALARRWVRRAGHLLARGLPLARALARVPQPRYAGALDPARLGGALVKRPGVRALLYGYLLYLVGAGALASRAGRALAGALSFARALDARAVRLLAVARALSFAAARGWFATRAWARALGSVGAVVRQRYRTLARALSLAAPPVRQRLWRVLAGALAADGAFRSSFTQLSVLAGTLGVQGAYTKQLYYALARVLGALANPPGWQLARARAATLGLARVARRRAGVQGLAGALAFAKQWSKPLYILNRRRLLATVGALQRALTWHGAAGLAAAGAWRRAAGVVRARTFPPLARALAGSRFLRRGYARALVVAASRLRQPRWHGGGALAPAGVMARVFPVVLAGVCRLPRTLGMAGAGVFGLLRIYTRQLALALSATWQVRPGRRFTRALGSAAARAWTAGLARGRALARDAALAAAVARRPTRQLAGGFSAVADCLLARFVVVAGALGLAAAPLGFGVAWVRGRALALAAGWRRALARPFARAVALAAAWRRTAGPRVAGQLAPAAGWRRAVAGALRQALVLVGARAWAAAVGHGRELALAAGWRRGAALRGLAGWLFPEAAWARRAGVRRARGLVAAGARRWLVRGLLARGLALEAGWSRAAARAFARAVALAGSWARRPAAGLAAGVSLLRALGWQPGRRFTRGLAVAAARGLRAEAVYAAALAPAAALVQQRFCQFARTLAVLGAWTRQAQPRRGAALAVAGVRLTFGLLKVLGRLLRPRGWRSGGPRPVTPRASVRLEPQVYAELRVEGDA